MGNAATSTLKEEFSLHFGEYSAKGRRKENQDRTHVTLIAHPKWKDSKECSDTLSPAIFGVFDGHGGGKCSKEISQSLPLNLRENPAYPADMEKALKESFWTTDHSYLEEAKKKGIKDGSTALLSVVYGPNLYVANAGDCRAILLDKKFEITVLSREHVPTIPEEKARIEKGGHSVKKGRINGNKLAISRALGDIEFKNTETYEEGAVSCNPEIRVFPLSHSDLQILILSSDGIWEVFDSLQVVEELKPTLKSVMDRLKDNVDPTEEIYTGCMKLVEAALRKGSKDNVSVIIVAIKPIKRGKKSRDQSSEAVAKEEEEDEVVEVGESEPAPPAAAV